jgi:hypothetical protein
MTGTRRYHQASFLDIFSRTVPFNTSVAIFSAMPYAMRANNGLQTPVHVFA